MKNMHRILIVKTTRQHYWNIKGIIKGAVQLITSLISDKYMVVNG